MESTVCGTYVLKNKPLPKDAELIVEKMIKDGEKILFVIVGDLNTRGKYDNTALIFSEDAVTVYDGIPGESVSYKFSDLKEIKSKRMYGNATLSAVMPNGKREIFFRYTYAVAALCDASALFIAHLNEGANFHDEMAVMEVTFERALSVCPKCGRTLLHPGAECIMCRSKVKIVKQLSSYMKPEKKKIIFCIIILPPLNGHSILQADTVASYSRGAIPKIPQGSYPSL